MSAFNASATVGSFVTLRTWIQERGEVPSFPSCTYRFFCERRKVSTYTEGEHKRYIRLHCIETLRRRKNQFLLQVLRNVETVVRVHLSLDRLCQHNGVGVEDEGIARLHPLRTAEVLQLRLSASFVLDDTRSSFSYLHLLGKQRESAHVLHNLKLVGERTLRKGTTVNQRSRRAERIPQHGNSSRSNLKHTGLAIPCRLFGADGVSVAPRF